MKKARKINKEIEDLRTIKQLNICRTLSLTTVEYIFFSTAHGTFFKIGHILGHKRGLDKVKTIEIIKNMFSDQNNKIRYK